MRSLHFTHMHTRTHVHTHTRSEQTWRSSWSCWDGAAADCVFIEDVCDLDVLRRRSVNVRAGGGEAAVSGLVRHFAIAGLQGGEIGVN